MKKGRKKVHDWKPKKSTFWGALGEKRDPKEPFGRLGEFIREKEGGKNPRRRGKTSAKKKKNLCNPGELRKKATRGKGRMRGLPEGIRKELQK